MKPLLNRVPVSTGAKASQYELLMRAAHMRFASVVDRGVLA